MTAAIRRLNDRGREAFREWLEDGATGAPPLALLDDPAMSDPLRMAIPRPDASFESRYDLGMELVDLLDVLDVAEVQVDAGLWDWLSLCLIDQICPPDEAKRRKPSQIDRYLLQLENHKTRYRHLVRSAWSLVRVHHSAARFMLAGPLHVHGEAAEQLGAYQDVITCEPLIEAIASLAWDLEKARLKRGFGGSGPGSARRVHVVSKQFRLTYDLNSMRPEQILALLPREFDRFREGPPPTGTAASAHRHTGPARTASRSRPTLTTPGAARTRMAQAGIAKTCVRHELSTKEAMRHMAHSCVACRPKTALESARCDTVFAHNDVRIAALAKNRGGAGA